MTWRNAEHYPDPTAGAALERLERAGARRMRRHTERRLRAQIRIRPDAPQSALRGKSVKLRGRLD